MNHTVSFEMAKRLKAAWWPDKGHFWFDINGGRTCLHVAIHRIREEGLIAAPILTELLEALPLGNGMSWYKKPAEDWEFYDDAMVDIVRSVNPCDAAAELWLWCKAKGYVK